MIEPASGLTNKDGVPNRKIISVAASVSRQSNTSRLESCKVDARFGAYTPLLLFVSNLRSGSVQHILSAMLRPGRWFVCQRRGRIPRRASVLSRSEAILNGDIADEIDSIHQPHGEIGRIGVHEQ